MVSGMNIGDVKMTSKFDFLELILDAKSSFKKYFSKFKNSF